MLSILSLLVVHFALYLSRVLLLLSVVEFRYIILVVLCKRTTNKAYTTKPLSITQEVSILGACQDMRRYTIKFRTQYMLHYILVEWIDPVKLVIPNTARAQLKMLLSFRLRALHSTPVSGFKACFEFCF